MEEQQRKPRPANTEGAAPRKKRRPAGAEGAVQHKKRRPAGAEGTVQHKKRRPADAEGAVQHKKRRPADAQRTANRSAAARRSASGSRSTQRSASQVRGGKRRPAQSAYTNIPQLSWGGFLVVLIAFIAVGIFMIRSRVNNANSYLQEYEASRPQYKMDEYVANLSDGFFSDMLADSADQLTYSDYETPALLETALRAEPDDSAKYSYEKTADFTESRPSYYITRNGEAVAMTTLDRSGWTEKHNLPIWRVGEPTSVVSVAAEPAYTAVITVPSDATVKINGVEVAAEKFIDAPSELQLTDNEQFYMKQPVSKSCEISGLYLMPELEVTDAAGNRLVADEQPDPASARLEYVFPHADETAPDEAFLNRVHDLTLAYMDYTINTRCTLEQNLAVLNNYLLPGSYLANLMQMISSDIWYNNDPNMREDHVYEVRHVKKYADNLCTVDVHLESTIGKVAVNDYICTIRWTLVNNGYGWYASNIVLLP